MFRHEELEEKLKDELCKVRYAQQAEECFEVEDTEEEIEDEFNLDLLERLCDNTWVKGCEDFRGNDKA